MSSENLVSVNQGFLKYLFGRNCTWFNNTIDEEVTVFILSNDGTEIEEQIDLAKKSFYSENIYTNIENSQKITIAPENIGYVYLKNGDIAIVFCGGGIIWAGQVKETTQYDICDNMPSLAISIPMMEEVD